MTVRLLYVSMGAKADDKGTAPNLEESSVISFGIAVFPPDNEPS